MELYLHSLRTSSKPSRRVFCLLARNLYGGSKNRYEKSTTGLSVFLPKFENKFCCKFSEYLQLFRLFCGVWIFSVLGNKGIHNPSETVLRLFVSLLRKGLRRTDSMKLNELVESANRLDMAWVMDSLAVHQVCKEVICCNLVAATRQTLTPH